MIERILAPNPSLYTGAGTNTYILASDNEVLVLDPGPVIDAHAAAIVAAIGDRTPVGVAVTHTHPDHAPMANPLAVTLGVPTLGFAPGPNFEPDVTVADGSTIAYGSQEILAIHTPGHTPDHLCFRHGDTLFTGDHIMEGSSVIIEDAAAYLDSLYLVGDLGVSRLEPGHGNGIDDAGRAISDYIEHRLQREREIVDAVGSGAGTIADIVDVVYAGIPSGLRHAAVHQVGVQLAKLSRDGAVTFTASHVTEQSEVRPG